VDGSGKQVELLFSCRRRNAHGLIGADCVTWGGRSLSPETCPPHLTKKIQGFGHLDNRLLVLSSAMLDRVSVGRGMVQRCVLWYLDDRCGDVITESHRGLGASPFFHSVNGSLCGVILCGHAAKGCLKCRSDSN